MGTHPIFESDFDCLTVMVSISDRISKVDDENTELNLDGLQKPDLSLLSTKADVITELSLNACKINNLSSLPKMPGLFKLQLNDNSLSDISELAAKCPGLMELSVSGNKKIASIDQLKPLGSLKTLLKIELEGCDIADDDDEEEEEESEEEESGGGGLAALHNADLPSEDEEDGDYDSNEEPEGSDGEDDEDEIIQPQEGNDEGAGSSGLSSGPPPKRARTVSDDSD